MTTKKKKALKIFLELLTLVGALAVLYCGYLITPILLLFQLTVGPFLIMFGLTVAIAACVAMFVIWGYR